MFARRQIVHVASVLGLAASAWAACCCPAVAARGDPPPLEVTGTGTHLTGHAEYLVDPGGTLTIEDLRGAPTDHEFDALTADALSQGLTTSAYWLRVRIVNPHGGPLPWTLLAEAAYLDHLDAWVFDDTGQVRTIEHGDRRPFAERGVQYRTLGFAHTTPPGGFSDVYLRVAHDRLDTMHLGFRVLPADALAVFLAGEYFVYGLLYGALLVLTVYALIIWRRAHDPRFGFYAAYILCTACAWMAVNGHLHQFVLPGGPELVNQGMHAVFLAKVITALLFSRSFLKTTEVLPRVDRLLTAAVGLLLVGIALRLGGVWGAPLLLAHAGLALLVLLVPVGIAAWRRGITYARWFVAAWLVYGGMLLLNALHVWGVVSWLPTGQLYPLAQTLNLLEIVMLAIAQSDRMGLLQRERQAAEQRYRALLESHNEMLERRVGERTHALAAAWAQAREESETDEVTGLGNRRFLLRAAERALAEPHPDAHQALAYFDLDGFKTINDTHGHAAGDEILRAFAAGLGAGVREGDLAARFGGDEFVLLLTGLHSVDEARRIVERICEQFRERATTHQGVVIGHTVSAGIAVRPPGAGIGLRTLLARADLALYLAKDRGRDRVVLENGGRETVDETPEPA